MQDHVKVELMDAFDRVCVFNLPLLLPIFEVTSADKNSGPINIVKMITSAIASVPRSVPAPMPTPMHATAQNITHGESCFESARFVTASMVGNQQDSGTGFFSGPGGDLERRHDKHNRLTRAIPTGVLR